MINLMQQALLKHLEGTGIRSWNNLLITPGEIEFHGHAEQTHIWYHEA